MTKWSLPIVSRNCGNATKMGYFLVKCPDLIVKCPDLIVGHHHCTMDIQFWAEWFDGPTNTKRRSHKISKKPWLFLTSFSLFVGKVSPWNFLARKAKKVFPWKCKSIFIFLLHSFCTVSFDHQVIFPWFSWIYNFHFQQKICNRLWKWAFCFKIKKAGPLKNATFK